MLGSRVSKRVTDYTELMRLHDEAFVEEAYALVLGRKPDKVGLKYYVSRLRIGHGRLSVISQLSKSTEARSNWDQLPGLREALERLKASRRIGGWKLALTDPEVGRTGSLRRARALQNNVASQNRQIEKSLEKFLLQQDQLKELVSEFGERPQSGRQVKVRRDAAGREELQTPVLRSRKVDEVRANDLAASAKSILTKLRF